MAVYEDIDEIEVVDEAVDHPRGRHAHAPRPHTTPILLGALIVIGVGVLAIDAMRDDSSSATPEAQAPAATEAPAAADSAATATAEESSVADASLSAAQLAVAPVDDTTPGVDDEGCMLDVTSVKQGDSGPNVECVQKALTAVGFYTGPVDGQFSPAVSTSATAFQT